MKIELHTKDGQVFHAQVKTFPHIGERVVSEGGLVFTICSLGRTYKNYPYHMYQVNLYTNAELQTLCATPSQIGPALLIESRR